MSSCSPCRNSALSHLLLPRSILLPYTTLFRSVFDQLVDDPPGEIARHGEADALIAAARGDNAGVDADQFTACVRSEEHTSELQSLRQLVCRLLFEPIKPQ